MEGELKSSLYHICTKGNSKGSISGRLKMISDENFEFQQEIKSKESGVSVGSTK